MRERFDEKGNLIGFHQMIFENIPDDYKVRTVILEDKIPDLSYLAVMRLLRDIKAGEEFEDNRFYSSELLSHMALDYLNSAIFLRQGIVADRGEDVVSYYLIPCAFLCKHSIELKLKECLLAKGEQTLIGHSVRKLWNQLDELQLPQYESLRDFIIEVDEIDRNEMALRYGISKDLVPLSAWFKFDIDNLLTNAMFLFNVVDEHIIHKYRYGGAQ